MREYIATILFGMFLGLSLAWWYREISQLTSEFHAYTISTATVCAIASGALFAWAWKSRA